MADVTMSARVPLDSMISTLLFGMSTSPAAFTAAADGLNHDVFPIPMSCPLVCQRSVVTHVPSQQEERQKFRSKLTCAALPGYFVTEFAHGISTPSHS
jgi:hypothetical protein